jgi:dihydropyrimidine dehydrogenase (NADP+)/dihydropyrimidine dehydrogenase (NAD+) subunit PreA
MGVNLDTLRPEPTVEGYTTPGGYSCKAVRPVALRMVMECAQMIRKKFPKGDAGVSPVPSLSGIGGIETGEDAAQFILLGANTVQVCTGVMIHGYKLIHELKAGLLKFMEKHKLETVDDFCGASLPYFTTHADLVARQAAAKAMEKSRVAGDGMVKKDDNWSGDRFVEQSDKLVANN